MMCMKIALTSNCGSGSVAAGGQHTNIPRQSVISFSGRPAAAIRCIQATSEQPKPPLRSLNNRKLSALLIWK
jgi:hypothetical protein